MRRPVIRVAVGVAAVLALLYVAASAYLWFNQRALIFQPSGTVDRTPASFGLAYEDVSIPLSGAPAIALHGWWVPAADATAPPMLYLHGNDGNVASNLERVARLREIGFSVLAIDYRGYGASRGGPPSEALVYEDAEAAWNYLVAQRRVDPARAYIYGHSLGGAIAIDLGVRHPESAGVIAESTFTTLSAMARAAYPMFATDWLLDQRFDSLDKVSRLRTPVLFIHGTADVEVPYAMSVALHAAAREPKRLLLVPGAGHEDCITAGAAIYRRALRDFVTDGKRVR